MEMTPIPSMRQRAREIRMARQLLALKNKQLLAIKTRLSRTTRALLADEAEMKGKKLAKLILGSEWY